MLLSGGSEFRSAGVCGKHEPPVEAGRRRRGREKKQNWYARAFGAGIGRGNYLPRGLAAGGMRAGRDHAPQVGGITAVLTTVLTRRHETCVKTMVFLSVP